MGDLDKEKCVLQISFFKVVFRKVGLFSWVQDKRFGKKRNERGIKGGLFFSKIRLCILYLERLTYVSLLASEESEAR